MFTEILTAVSITEKEDLNQKMIQVFFGGDGRQPKLRFVRCYATFAFYVPFASQKMDRAVSITEKKDLNQKMIQAFFGGDDHIQQPQTAIMR